MFSGSQIQFRSIRRFRIHAVNSRSLQFAIIPVALAAAALVPAESVPPASTDAFHSAVALSEAGQKPRRVERVWPEPPASARIKFLTSLAPRAAARRSLFRRLWNA